MENFALTPNVRTATSVYWIPGQWAFSFSAGRLKRLLSRPFTVKKVTAKKSKLRGGSGGARLMKSPVATVLFIDDDPNDAELLQAAMRKAKAEFILRTVADGEIAMAYLNGQGIYSDRVRYRIPSLVLLDLKMPRATGFEVLKWIRTHPAFGKLPVVVLSGSELQDDIQRAYAVGANAYLIKPLGFNALVGLVHEIETQWLNTPPIAPSLNSVIVNSEDFRSDDRL